jgi:hypothetical protein
MPVKKLAVALVLLTISGYSFSQVNFNNTQGNMLILSLGMNKTVIDNPGFDAWTRTNYNKTENYILSGNIDIAFITKKYDFGLGLNAPYPYGVGSFYFGRRLTSKQSWISSFLNFEAGVFEAVYTDIAPVNYTFTSSQQGQNMQLHYYNTYFGLTSKNYINGLSFRSGKGRKGVSFNSGFYFRVGYEPWKGDWEYGYYTGSGKYAQFHGQKVNGIPQLNNMFMDTGIFIGIGT